jgi:hypothetical protein
VIYFLLFPRFPFLNSNASCTDDDSYLDTVQASMDIGTITLQIWRIEVQEVVSETLKHRYGAPTLDDRIVHERSKKAGAHHVTCVAPPYRTRPTH